MSRFTETEIALIERLRALKAARDVSIAIPDIGVPPDAAGFSQEVGVLRALEQDKVIAFGAGNRLLMPK
ncbi:hypothetical protein GFL78_26825 [Rhizobium leguminosarum bv. viciae]|nr:hypothetical protein [Rhizobium leguminosarum bv. viciae]